MIGWGLAASRVSEILGLPLTSSKAALKTLWEPVGYFALEDWTTKVGTISRKEGNLGFLRMILKTIPNLIFILSLHELSSWLISNAFLPLSPLMSFPAWHQSHGKTTIALPNPFLKPPVNFKACPESLLFFVAFSDYSSPYSVSFHSDHFPNL